MYTAEEQSKEMAIFCRQQAKKDKRAEFTYWLNKAVLQGVSLALLAVSLSGGTGLTPDKSHPWLVAG